MCKLPKLSAVQCAACISKFIEIVVDKHLLRESDVLQEAIEGQDTRPSDCNQVKMQCSEKDKSKQDGKQPHRLCDI